jgi:nitrate reductase NapAB chaperone NapD
MSILGVVLRIRDKDRAQVQQRLARTPGVDLGPDAGGARLVAVIESTAETPAAAIMSEIAGWPEVHNLSLVYEHSGDDEPAGPSAGAEFDFRAWRGHAGDFARRQARQQPPLSVSPTSTSAASGAGEAR